MGKSRRPRFSPRSRVEAALLQGATVVRGPRSSTPRVKNARGTSRGRLPALHLQHRRPSGIDPRPSAAPHDLGEAAGEEESVAAGVARRPNKGDGEVEVEGVGAGRWGGRSSRRPHLLAWRGGDQISSLSVAPPRRLSCQPRAPALLCAGSTLQKRGRADETNPWSSVARASPASSTLGPTSSPGFAPHEWRRSARTAAAGSRRGKRGQTEEGGRGVLLAGGELVAALITATPAHIPRSLAAQPRRAGFAATVATEETSVAPPAGRPVVAAITDLHAAGAESATRRQPHCLPS
jgi:hypothetical protein